MVERERDVTWDWGGPTVELDGGWIVPSRIRAVYKDASHRGSPDFELLFEVRDGAPVCVELTFRSTETGRGVSTTDLRLFDLDKITTVTFLRRVQRKDDPGVITSDDPGFEELKWSAIKAITQAQSRRKRVTRAELEEVARIYNDNLTGNPTEAVWSAMGYGSMSTAARRVQACRDPEVGLLPPTTQGKKQGSEES